jgi:uncharacterized iron-regulated protein
MAGPQRVSCAVMNCRTLLVSFFLLGSQALAQAPRPLPSLEDATRCYDSTAGQAIAWPALLDKLAALDVVFLGETHVDDTTHRVELHVLEELLARRKGKVVLSMEMFEHDVQPVLDDYLAGRIDEATFQEKARPWENYQTAYRPLIEAAKAAGIPVVAANFPGTLRRQLAMGGKKAVEALTPAQRALMPAEIFPASDAYWERVGRAVRGHMGGGGSGTPEERLYDTQNLWDNSMGDNVSKARIAHPDSIVLHVAGGFHVAYRDGTVAQFARRSPDSKFATAEISPTSGLHLVRPERDVAQADFLIYAEAHARDLNDGTYAVEVPAELRYRLDVPEGKANLPMLVWLPDHATRSEDAFAYWQAMLASDAALAVVEAPFPEVQDDLAIGGRYAAGDGFRGDYTRMQHGLARIVEYVTRRFPVDANRVVIAGAGDGGAVVLWTALYGEWLPVDMLAIDPTDLTRLSMEALPDLKPVARSLQLRTRGDDTTRLEKVGADYAKLGVAVTTSPLGLQPRELPSQLRKMLGLPNADRPSAAGGPTTLELENDLPRAREWAELYATHGVRDAIVVGPATKNEGKRTLLAVGGDGLWPVASFANGAGLPLAGGPFGGTTVVVLPKGISDADRATWLAHEKNKVIKRRSMFANIAIASADGEPTLPQVMADLKKRGRSRVLIVPAVFCADAATMRTLKEQLGDAAAGMDVSWLPGLGSELAKGSH